VRFPPPAIYAILIGAGFLLQRRWPEEIWPGHVREMRVAGAFLFAVGAALGLWAVATFRRSGTSPNPMAPTRALAAGGPYRFTRNPMYLGISILSAGFAVFWNALWPLLTVPVAILLVTFLVIAKEEAYLERLFGTDYLGYKSRVRRWM
jgi:protein-S-isoprenylcysteine O-methyltransferase Ste14